jgi:hypothetical protein
MPTIAENSPSYGSLKEVIEIAISHTRMKIRAHPGIPSRLSIAARKKRWKARGTLKGWSKLERDNSFCTFKFQASGCVKPLFA